MDTKIQHRITLNRHATLLKGRNLDQKDQKWYFQIVRLFSGSEIRLPGAKTFSPNYDKHFPASFPSLKTGAMSIYTQCKFYIAVQELIIEWLDYQTEASGYIYCHSCEDQIANSEWLNHANKNSDGFQIKNDNDAKKLIRFVKQPGLKTTVIKIERKDLVFFPIDIDQCGIVNTASNRQVFNAIMEVRNERMLECEIRSLFDLNQVLPIKHAHITVEIIIK